ncbi:MAG: hypothetical protein JW743_07735 [Deltaproteobacteria bacterium]|nr:hypothetical protein [Deltaproteobacteria bacterium]MBN2845347.1 hypothetical protein [Deltaproteobacteria bacterium]
MTRKNRTLTKYIERYSVGDRWPLVCNVRRNVDNIVVIPALAELSHLFRTLESLSKNPVSELARTLVICVVNNRAGSSEEEIDDNQRTLTIVRSLIHGRVVDGIEAGPVPMPIIHTIVKSGIKIGYVDASSPGCEMDDRDGGVGLARKIGFDRALELFDHGKEGVKLLFSLDADTLVNNNYLSAVRDYFEKTGSRAAVLSFEHQKAMERKEQEAICCYEMFLRSYVLGLRYAGSRYAHHSVGSIIVCTAEAYTDVRGMNKRKAGEDFYFLNKLAKAHTIGLVNTTRVYPSSRSSNRVPFGTGRRIEGFKNGSSNEYLAYNPKTFHVLKEWLRFMSSGESEDMDRILSRAKKIHIALEAFLRENRFNEAWPRLVKNAKTPDVLSAHFHLWFDGFKQFKLIRYLTRNSFPAVNMFEAIEKLLEMTGEKNPIDCKDGEIPPLCNQEKVLDYLRHVEYD